MIPVWCLLVLSALLFFIGVFGFVTRRNLIAMLISVELVLNAADLQFSTGSFTLDSLTASSSPCSLLV